VQTGDFNENDERSFQELLNIKEEHLLPGATILAGSPGSGKSSLIEVFEHAGCPLKCLTFDIDGHFICTAKEHQGFQVVAEVATQVIEDEQRQGNSFPWEHPDFQQKIANWQQREDGKINLSAPAFLDRCNVDVIGYCNLLKEKKISKEMTEAACKTERECEEYIGKRRENNFFNPKQQVFLFLPLAGDRITETRREGYKEAMKTYNAIHAAYQSLGFTIHVIDPNELNAVAPTIKTSVLMRAALVTFLSLKDPIFKMKYQKAQMHCSANASLSSVEEVTG